MPLCWNWGDVSKDYCRGLLVCRTVWLGEQLHTFRRVLVPSGVQQSKKRKDRQWANSERNIQSRSCQHFCRGIAIRIMYSECVSVALVIQHAKRMHRVILSSVACPALQDFSTLSHKRHDFFREKGELLNIKCALIFCTTFAWWSISHYKKNSARHYHECN